MELSASLYGAKSFDKIYQVYEQNKDLDDWDDKEFNAEIVYFLFRIQKTMSFFSNENYSKYTFKEYHLMEQNYAYQIAKMMD